MVVAATAQSQKPCTCTYKLKYPPKAVDSNISGKVIVEMDEDENGIQSNPVVIKGLGYGCDEEALRITKIFINCHNKCETRYRPQTKIKIKQTVNFEIPPDDEPGPATNKNPQSSRLK